MIKIIFFFTVSSIICYGKYIIVFQNIYAKTFSLSLSMIFCIYLECMSYKFDFLFEIFHLWCFGISKQNKRMIVALDLETTWLNSTNDAIIEVALIKIDTQTFATQDTYNTFVNPEREIPEIISNITNITQKDVQDAPLFAEIQDDVRAFIWDCPILGHNTNFDRSFLMSHGVSLEKNLVLDTFFLANFLLSELKSLNLWFICSHLWIKITSEHRAIYDTDATIQVYKKLISLLQNTSKEEKKIFRYITDKSQDKQGIFYREKYLKNIKSLSEEKVVKYILSTIDNNKTSYKIEQSYESDTQNIESIFKKLDGFETRENQKKMAQIVYSSLTQSKKSAIEAPTGIGKTFAYLIPAVIFSVEFGEQVFISTSTKTLQDQIFFKDLEFLSKNTGIDFSFTKLKGKKNYIGIYAFFEFLETEKSLSTNLTSFFLKIIFWLSKTVTWELDELDFYGEEYSFLREINASLPYTFHNDNPYISYEFIIVARDRAKKSNIVVINNHILFQDIVSEGRLLWKVKNLVLDEAHSLEDVVTQSLKKGFSIVWVEKVFIEFEKNLKKQWQILPEVLYKREKIVFDITALLDTFSLYLSSKVSQDSKYRNVLIKSDFFSKYQEAKSIAVNIQKGIQELIVSLKELPEKNQLLLGKEISYFSEIQEILSRIFSDSEDFQEIISIVSHREKYGIILEYTLLNPWRFLKNSLWNNLDSIILTSATLKIEESFDYIKNILSLWDFDLHELKTDFDYSKQSLLFIPNDLGSIKHNTEQVFDFFRQLFPIIGGRTLVLFTAFSMIQDCYISLNHYLKEKNIHLLAQSIWWSKRKQIEFFLKTLITVSSSERILSGRGLIWRAMT